MHPVSQVSTRISVLQDLFKTPQELYRQAIATRNSFHIWPPWGIAFLHVCVTSRQVKVGFCKSTPQAWGGSPCLYVIVKGRTMVAIWMIIHDHRIR